MKFVPLFMLAALAAASPISPATHSLNKEINASGNEAELHTRQLGFLTATSNDLLDGQARACPKVIFIFARASIELGNMGLTTGPAVASVLQSNYGASNVWVQGVGGQYTADYNSNYLPGGTSQAAVNEAIGLFQLANQKCPGTPIVAGGYSQGTAVIAGAVPKLSRTVRDQVKGIVFFGYTQNVQNRGGIYGYPSTNLKVYCATGDLYCEGILMATIAHFSYVDDALGPAPEFLESKIDRY